LLKDIATNNFFIQQGIRKVALLNLSSKLSDSIHMPDMASKLQQSFAVEFVLTKQNYHLDPLTNDVTRQRAEIFMQLLRDKSVDAIWFVRGGEGAADIIPIIDQHKSELEELQPKVLFGYSDITALHLYFAQTYNWPCVHAPLAYDIYSERITMSEYLNFDNLQRLNNISVGANDFEAPLTGGNLTLVALSVAEIWQMQAANKIILLEEVNEPVHAIMRNLKHLNRIGFFSGAKAIVFGQLIDSNAQHERLQQALRMWASELPVPVLQGAAIGHGANNLPWRLG
jgi:muramoyltetrapeptide carboxypeptidase